MSTPGGDSDTDGGIDDVLADSFPASDPPPWVPTIAEAGSSGDASVAGATESSAISSAIEIEKSAKPGKRTKTPVKIGRR